MKWLRDHIDHIERLRPIFIVTAACILTAAFYLLYTSKGIPLSHNYAYKRYNVLFGSDIPRVISDLTDPWANHYRTKVHPLFVLLGNPIGTKLAALNGDAAVGAIKLTAAVGALCVPAFLGYLRLLGLPMPESILTAVAFGLSTVQMVWSSVPETFVYGCLTLLLVHIGLLLAWKKIRAAYLLIPCLALLSISITTTNYLQGLICLALAAMPFFKQDLLKCRSKAHRYALTAVWLTGCIVFSFSTAVSLGEYQRELYPSCIAFNTAAAYDEEPKYMNWDNLKAPVQTGFKLLTSMGAYSLIGPPPEVIEMEDGSGTAAVFNENSHRKYSFTQAFAVALWAVLLLVGLVLGTKVLLPYLAVVLSLIVNFGIHSVYGTSEAFLYSAHSFFLMMALAGMGLLYTANRGGWHRAAGLVLILSVAVLELASNLDFMDRLDLLLYTLG